MKYSEQGYTQDYSEDYNNYKHKKNNDIDSDACGDMDIYDREDIENDDYVEDYNEFEKREKELTSISEKKMSNTARIQRNYSIDLSRKVKKMSYDETLELIKQCLDENQKKAEVARTKLYYQYFKLVYKILIDNYSTYINLYLEDLLNCAFESIYKALPKYVEISQNKKLNFSTFLTLTIQHNVYLYIAETIHHFNPHETLYRKKILKALQTLREEDRPVTKTNICLLTGISARTVDKIMKSGDRTECEWNPNEHDTANFETPETVFEKNSLYKELEQAILSLDEEEKNILLTVFNMGGEAETTKANVAEKFGMPIFRLNTILERAKQKLRDNSSLRRMYKPSTHRLPDGFDEISIGSVNAGFDMENEILEFENLT